MNEYKTKSETKKTANEYRYFLEINFVGVNRLFVLIYLNRKNDAKRFKSWRCYLPKGNKLRNNCSGKAVLMSHELHFTNFFKY